jgi:endonuclease YncB( thermonuclease family)
MLLVAAGLNYVYRVGVVIHEDTKGYAYAAEKPIASIAAIPSIFDSVGYVETHDGDTFFINLPSLPPVFGDRMPVRISHIDAAEINGKRRCEKRMAEAAKAKLTILLSTAKIISLRDVKRDKYFRLNAEVLADGVDVSNWMLSQRLAYKYEGETKPSVNWCTFSP